MDFKCGKKAALKDNINIQFKGFGWDDCRVTWSKDGVKKTIPDLKAELLDIMKRTKGRAVLSTSASNIPRRKNTNVLGTMTKFQRGRDDKKTLDEICIKTPTQRPVTVLLQLILCG